MATETLSREPARPGAPARPAGPMRPGRRARLLLAAAALLFLAAHLPWLGDTLDDIDAFNFALGAREFDPARHQPHPPGSPLYVYLARGSTAVLDAVRPEPGGTPVAPQRNAAEGLSLWSALAGTLSLFVLPYLFLRLAREDARSADMPGPGVAMAATALTVACPLFWFSAARPLSDVPGLAAALGVQALTLAAFERARQPGRGYSSLLLAAFFAALVVGLRSQTMWLTLPLLAVVLAARWRSLSRRRAALVLLALAAGVAVWALPLLAASGGLRGYLSVLANQGAEDFGGVDMLYRAPTARRLVLGLAHTFVWPWGSPALAGVVLVLALAGALRAAWRFPRALVAGVVAFAPYALFHLTFQETVTTRYALPLVPATAWLAAVGAWTLAGRFALPLLAAAAVSGLALVWPASMQYREAGSPGAQLVTALAAEAARSGEAPVIGMHQRVEMDTRRAFGWMLEGRAPRWTRLASAPRDEVWDVLRYWDEGGRAPVWFLANPARTDLALVDPAAVVERRRFSWPPAARVLAGNTRPNDVVWYVLRDPGWYLGEGWALTPEIAGRSAGRGVGPSIGGIEARVRHRPGAATLLVGGRNLGEPGAPAARVDVSFDGRPILTADVAPGFFTRLVRLPAGSLDGKAGFGTLRVTASGEAPVAIEQFDVQDEGEIVFAFGPGWHEAEYSLEQRRLWRWTSDRAQLLVRAGEGASGARVEIEGDAAGRFFDGARTITLRAAGREVASVRARGAFVLGATVSAADLREAAGVIVLTTDATFVPREQGESADARRLGLKVYRVKVTRPAAGP